MYCEGIGNPGSSISLNTSIDGVSDGVFKGDGDESTIIYSASFSPSSTSTEFSGALLFRKDNDNLLLALLILSGVLRTSFQLAPVNGVPVTVIFSFWVPVTLHCAPVNRAPVTVIFSFQVPVTLHCAPVKLSVPVTLVSWGIFSCGVPVTSPYSCARP